MKLRGIVPIVLTTFREDGSLDIESQRRLVRHLLDEGAHGLGLFGNASEGYALTDAEKQELLAVIMKEVKGRVPVVVSSGHTGTFPAIANSVAAEKGGADALMVLPPYLLKPDGAGLYDYFAAISKAVKIPIMVQDAPVMTGVSMPSALLARMGREIDNVRYVKVEAPPTAPKITELSELAGASLELLGGLNGNFLPEEFHRGAIGSMPGSDLCREFVDMWNALENGNQKEAAVVFCKALPLIRYELQPGLGVATMKHNLQAKGIIASATVRPPTRSLDPRAIEEVEQLRTDLEG